MRARAAGSSLASCGSPRDAIVTIACPKMLKCWANGRAMPAPPRGVNARKSIPSIVSSMRCTSTEMSTLSPTYPRTAAFSMEAGRPPHMTCHNRVVGFPHDTTARLDMILLMCWDNVLKGFPALPSPYRARSRSRVPARRGPRDRGPPAAQRQPRHLPASRPHRSRTPLRGPRRGRSKVRGRVARPGRRSRPYHRQHGRRRRTDGETPAMGIPNGCPSMPPPMGWPAPPGLPSGAPSRATLEPPHAGEPAASWPDRETPSGTPPNCGPNRPAPTPSAPAEPSSGGVGLASVADQLELRQLVSKFLFERLEVGPRYRTRLVAITSSHHICIYTWYIIYT